MTSEEMELEVWRKYPKTEKERYCSYEKQKRKYLRDEYRRELNGRIQAEASKEDGQVREKV